MGSLAIVLCHEFRQGSSVDAILGRVALCLIEPCEERGNGLLAPLTAQHRDVRSCRQRRVVPHGTSIADGRSSHATHKGNRPRMQHPAVSDGQRQPAASHAATTTADFGILNRSTASIGTAW